MIHMLYPVSFLSLPNRCILSVALFKWIWPMVTYTQVVCQTTGYSKCNKIVQICKLLVVSTEKLNSSSLTASTVPQIFLLSSLVALWVRRTTPKGPENLPVTSLFDGILHFTSFNSFDIWYTGAMFCRCFQLRVHFFQLLTLLILKIFFRKTCFSNKSTLQFRNLNNTVKTTKASLGRSLQFCWHQLTAYHL